MFHKDPRRVAALFAFVAALALIVLISLLVPDQIAPTAGSNPVPSSSVTTHTVVLTPMPAPTVTKTKKIIKIKRQVIRVTVTARADRSRQQSSGSSGTNYASGNTVWDRLAQCESGGNWAINTGNGYYGGLQFTLSSWSAVGGSGYPHQATRSEQIMRGQRLQAQQGWGAWPACAAQLGLL